MRGVHTCTMGRLQEDSVPTEVGTILVHGDEEATAAATVSPPLTGFGLFLTGCAARLLMGVCLGRKFHRFAF